MVDIFVAVTPSFSVRVCRSNVSLWRVEPYKQIKLKKYFKLLAPMAVRLAAW